MDIELPNEIKENNYGISSSKFSCWSVYNSKEFDITFSVSLPLHKEYDGGPLWITLKMEVN